MRCEQSLWKSWARRLVLALGMGSGAATYLIVRQGIPFDVAANGGRKPSPYSVEPRLTTVTATSSLTTTETDFRLNNRSDSGLRLTGFLSTCRCAAPNGAIGMRIPPGGSADVRLLVKPLGLTSGTKANFTFLAEDARGATCSFAGAVEVRLPVGIGLAPARIDFGHFSGERDLWVSAEGVSIRSACITKDVPGLEFSMQPSKDGRRLKVAIRSAHEGTHGLANPFHTVIAVRTDNPRIPELGLIAFGVVEGAAM